MTDGDDFLFHLDDPETAQENLPYSTAVLIMGILSIPGAFFFGFPGIIIGLADFLLAKRNMALYRAAPDSYTPTGYSNTNTGRICSLIGLSLGSFFFLLIVLDFFLRGRVY